MAHTCSANSRRRDDERSKRVRHRVRPVLVPITLGAISFRYAYALGQQSVKMGNANANVLGLPVRDAADDVAPRSWSPWV